MEDEFYGTIKLTTGEEIISKIVVLDDNDNNTLLLEHPVIMETIFIRQIGATTIKIQPWLKYADDSMCIIKMDKVITISEIKDLETINVYEKYLRKKDNISGKTKITPNMGYLCSISEARKSLEKLYRSN